jgi:general secretion pathway protein A
MKPSVNPSLNPLQLYARQWGMSALPFTELSDESWLETAPIKRAGELFEQTTLLRGLMLLAGTNGSGKSTLVGRWLRQLDQRLFYPLALTHASLTGSSILASLTLKLGKPAGLRRERNLLAIEQALAELERRTLVVVIDEAQNYSHSALEEIRLLLGLNLPERPTFALVLVGDDYLLGTLRLRHHRALFSRIRCHYQLQPWTMAEIVDYLEKSLASVGISRQVFEPAAADLLAGASGGIARSLQILARTAWIEAASEKAQSVLAAHVQKAIDQVPYAPGKQMNPQELP